MQNLSHLEKSRFCSAPYHFVSLKRHRSRISVMPGCAECCNLCIVVPSVVMLSVVMLYFFMLNVVVLNAVALY